MSHQSTQYPIGSPKHHQPNKHKLPRKYQYIRNLKYVNKVPIKINKFTIQEEASNPHNIPHQPYLHHRYYHHLHPSISNNHETTILSDRKSQKKSHTLSFQKRNHFCRQQSSKKRSLVSVITNMKFIPEQLPTIKVKKHKQQYIQNVNQLNSYIKSFDIKSNFAPTFFKKSFK